MKKISILIILSLLLLPSCSKNKGLIIENTQKTLEDKPTADEGYEYLNGVGSWLDKEVEYVYYPTENDITCLYGNGISGSNSENILFTLQKEESIQDETGYHYTTGKPVYAYVNKISGEKSFICPDPLCTHGAYSDCQYLNLNNLVEAENGMLYCTKTYISNKLFTDTIYEINKSAGTITPIYTPSPEDDNLDACNIYLEYEKDGKLYYHFGASYEFVGDDGELEIKDEQQFVSLDLSTMETQILSSNFSDFVYVIGQVWDKMILIDSITHTTYATDLNFENPIVLELGIGAGYTMSNAYIDETNEEFYFLYVNSELESTYETDLSGKDIKCYLFKISKDLAVEEIQMPSKVVTSIQLTDEYIYYTIFDPTYYGSRNGNPVYDRTGGKIYRVHRDDTTTPELFFDGRGEIVFKDSYYIDGGNLYLKHYRAKGGTDDVSFYDTGSIARVNVENNTLAWINLY